MCVRDCVCVVDGFYIVLFSSLRQSHCAVCVRERERERERWCVPPTLCVSGYTHDVPLDSKLSFIKVFHRR